MAMKGWRRVGIVLSVIWFFGFGVLLWNEFVEDAVAPYAQDVKICSAIGTIQRRLLAGECP